MTGRRVNDGHPLHAFARDLGTILGPPGAGGLLHGRRAIDAQVAIPELQALRLELDLSGAAPGGAQAAALVERWTSTASAADRLRLPPPAAKSGPELRGAIHRVLAASAAPAAFAETAVVKEARMRRALGALEQMFDQLAHLPRRAE